MESTNNNCNQIEETLDAFHDGELTGLEHALVEEHLKTCSACLLKLAKIEQLVGHLKAMPRLEASASLTSKLDQIVDRRQSVSYLRPKVWAPVAAAAAVIIIAMSFGQRAPVTTSGAPEVANSNQQLPSQTPPTAVTQVQVQKPEKKPGIAEPHLVASQTTTGNDSTKEPACNPVNTQRKPQVIATSKTNPPEIAKASPSEQARITTGDEFEYDQIAELPNTTDSFTDAIGLATDEDGLYDIKM